MKAPAGFAAASLVFLTLLTAPSQLAEAEPTSLYPGEDVAVDVKWSPGGGIQAHTLFYRHDPQISEPLRTQLDDRFIARAQELKDRGDDRSLSQIVRHLWDDVNESLANREPPWTMSQTIEEKTHLLTKEAFRQGMATVERFYQSKIQNAPLNQKPAVIAEYRDWQQRSEAAIAEFPAAGLVQRHETAHLGEHSAVFELYSAEVVASSGCQNPVGTDMVPTDIQGDEVYCRRGPINVLFYDNGDWENVKYLMTSGWLGLTWEGTWVGADRAAFLYDERHQEADRWHDAQDSDLQLEGDVGCFDRTHMRIWGSVPGDYHWGVPGGFEAYSIGQAHVEVADGFCRHTVTSQNDGRDAVVDTWFGSGYAGSITLVDYGHTGTDFDGQIAWIEVLYYIVA